MTKNIRVLQTINSKKININIKNIIPDEIEKFIIKKINKNAPESYGKITDSELDNIEKQVFQTFKFYINKHIIASIKSGYMKNYIIKNYFNLNKNSKDILEGYKKDGVLKLSSKFNLSPMTLVRYVFDNLYHKKLKELLKTNKLSSYDQEQFQLAEQNDIYVTLDQVEVSEQSIKFEKLIEEFLIKNNVEYKTQEQLTLEQKEKYGKVTITPDFLITSELIINSKKVNWIDAKNFYGSNIEFVVSKIKKQIQKYLDTYGSGCLIFNHGFNSELKFQNVLILDYDSL
jgi:hypothetical protein